MALQESKTAAPIEQQVESKSLLEQRLDGPLGETLNGIRKGCDDAITDQSSKPHVQRAINQFIELLVNQDDLVSDDLLETLGAMIQSLDEKLSEQVNLILHHPDFQKLEGSWRGLEHMVYGTETGTDLKIRVLNIGKDELGKAFKKYKGASWDQSPLFKKIYSEEYDMANGTPYGVLIGDYQFSNKAADVDILKGMGQIASAAHAPFIAGADPKILNLDSWEEVNQPRDLASVMEGPEWASWRGFRESLDARYVGLTLPRFLSRLPYGKDNKVDGFEFTEECEGGDHSKYGWSNAAYAMGTNITQAHKYYGWTACIRGKNSGGEVTGMHVHTYKTDAGGTEMKPATEVGIPGRREHELARLGFSTIVHHKNTDRAVFISAPSVYKPKELDDVEATANSNLNGALPYIFVVSRFAHYINRMIREAVGSFTTRAELEAWLNNWIAGYVLLGEGTQEQKAKNPLSEAQVTVEEVPGQPGYYSAVFLLKPHYQLEGVTASLRLVSKVKKA